MGVSIGVERIFSILESRKSSDPAERAADVYVCSAHKGIYEPRLKLVNRLWKEGVRAEHSYRLNPKLLTQFQYCEKHRVPLAIVIGESELSRNVVQLRDVDARQEREVPMDSLVLEIRKHLENV